MQPRAAPPVLAVQLVRGAAQQQASHGRVAAHAGQVQRDVRLGRGQVRSAAHTGQGQRDVRLGRGQVRSGQSPTQARCSGMYAWAEVKSGHCQQDGGIGQVTWGGGDALQWSEPAERATIQQNKTKKSSS